MMRRMMLLLFLGILAFGDGGFFWQDPYAELEKADQLAFVYYEKQRETLILSISYKGKAGNFAWVIPLPSPPEVSLAPKDFFPQLGELLYSLHHPAHQRGRRGRTRRFCWRGRGRGHIPPEDRGLRYIRPLLHRPRCPL